MARSDRLGGRRRLVAVLVVGGVAAGVVAIGGVDPAGASGQAPVAVADTFHAAGGVERTVDAPGVLANDTDGEGDALTASIVTGASNGQLSLKPDGSFTYEADADFTGTDTFAYRADDGTELSETVQVSIVVRSPLESYVTALYDDFLSRAPDPSGLRFWVSRIERMVETRESVARRMAISHEYSVKVVNRMYGDVLGRSVDPSGREYWAKRIQKGMSPSTLLFQLMGSNEFLTRSGGTPGGFIDKVYAAIVDRPPTETERAQAVARIESGRRRQPIIGELYFGTESRTRRVRVQYLDLLDREPTSEELDAGVAKLVGIVDDVDFAVWLASSTEYLFASYTE
ncbi:MAG: outer rane adhesin like protein [Ilumatobacteraceae bacterium]|nr:outer rane adhesin like protein [Ilumatobacteraceae bacterium]